VIRVLLLLLTTFLGAPMMAAPEEGATPSRLAAKRLLLDAADAGSRLVAVGERGHVVLSDDRGASWRQARSVPTRKTLTGVSFVDERFGWAVGHDAVVIHTEDGGESWVLQHAAPELEAPLLSVWFESPSEGIAVGAFGMRFETSDGGRTWRRADDGSEDRHLNDVFVAAGVGFAAAEAGSAYRSTDGVWTRLALPYAGSLWGGLALDDGAILIFGMGGHVFRSEDLGLHWSEVHTGTDQSLIGAAQLGGGRVHLVGLGGTLLSSSDGGRTFRSTTRPHRRALTAVTAGAEGLVLFGEGGAELAPDPLTASPGP